MCKTTKGTQTAGNEPLRTAAATPPAPPPVVEKPLQKYLAQAVAEVIATGELGPSPHMPVSLIALATDGVSHRYAGVLDEEMHYSASLLKVAAMFAAFRLRSTAASLLKKQAFSAQPAFFAALEKVLDAGEALPQIRAAGIGLKPNLPAILATTGLGTATQAVKFTADFDHHLHEMIVPSENDSAGVCIRRLGYSYINVSLMKAGLYDAAAARGIWLAGDFSGGKKVETDSVNDGKVAQATTSRQMCRFFSLVRQGKLVGDGVSDAEMQALLHEATGKDPAWISRGGGVAVRRFDIDLVKIGKGPLKAGPFVYSEGAVLVWKGDKPQLAARKLTGDIAVCWQNLLADPLPSFDGVVNVINNAFAGFLAQAP